MTRRRHRCNRMWMIAGLLFLMTACAGETAPPSPPKREAPSPAVQKVEPAAVDEKKLPEKKQEPEFQYNPVGKPDPFKPFIQLTPVRELTRTAPLTPLQKYDLSQLKLVAIIATREGNVAMVEDSAGKGYFIRKGTEIGKNDGKVAKILKDRVIIEELYPEKNEVTIFLHKIEEGGES